VPSVTALPIVVPLASAAALVGVLPLSRRWFNDLAGVCAASAAIVFCVLLVDRSASQPFAYWLGGWHPSHGATIGISLSIDPLGAGLAAFSALLVLAALVYSLRYFEDAGGLFHALMLLFGGAMVGFCLTGDLFNLVVFFELMGTAAYALTAHKVEERGPIQGAINFAITNSIAGYAMFVGVALLYARTGALNMAQVGAALDGHHADPLVLCAMAILFVGFLTKAAAVPLHFWLADAHAVAPTPVCVLFSGVMIELGAYAVARLYWVVFAGTLHPHVEALRAILVIVGAMTGLAGAAMCVLQRHVKRLLAFSSIAHVGVLICGIGLLEHRALAGAAVYLVGHGLAKAALFLCAGVLLHRFATIDEYELHGRGRVVWPAGVLFAIGGLLLAGVPPFTPFAGKSLLEAASSGAGYGWLIFVYGLVSALTGGAILRVAGRVFLGWGPAEGPEQEQARAAHEPSDEESAARDRTPPMMLLVPGVLLALCLAGALIPDAVAAVERDAARFADHGAYAGWVLRHVPISWHPVAIERVSGDDLIYAFACTLGAIGVAALGLFGRGLRESLPRAVAAPVTLAVRTAHGLHSGQVGDYIAWWTAGAALLGATCLLVLG
jgi:multicomponent Na+:H+ antiporter subunit D